MREDFLEFSKGNAKLANDIAIFSLPSGHSCPGALECMARAHPETGKITDGPAQKFRCYAASMEAVFPALRAKLWRNYNLLSRTQSYEGVEGVVKLINESLPRKGVAKIRVHASGDFFSKNYFDAWMKVAEINPDLLFYAYTKSLNHWTSRFVQLESIPSNFVLTASRGGRYDHLIDRFDLREAVVVYYPDEAKSLGLEIDHTDAMAYDPNIHKFALLIHGVQPTGSIAAEALKTMKKEGVKYSYGSGK